MIHLFSFDSLLPSNIIMSIMFLLTPNDLLSLQLVCKNWLTSLCDQKFRTLQVSAWKTLFPSYVLSCEFNSNLHSIFGVIKIYNTPNSLQTYNSLIYKEFFDNQYYFALIVVEFGLLYFIFWDEIMVLRFLICNPLTKCLRVVGFPFHIDGIGIYLPLSFLYQFSKLYIM